MFIQINIFGPRKLVNKLNNQIILANTFKQKKVVILREGRIRETDYVGLIKRLFGPQSQRRRPLHIPSFCMFRKCVVRSEVRRDGGTYKCEKFENPDPRSSKKIRDLANTP